MTKGDRFEMEIVEEGDPIDNPDSVHSFSVSKISNLIFNPNPSIQ
jgi:hypothetical protein